jgi:fatty-acyl-CoA synthase
MTSATGPGRSIFAGPDAPISDQTIGSLLDTANESFPENVALASCSEGIRLTYRELTNLSNHFALGLIALGLKPGDRIGLWSPNCARWTVVQFAAAKAGLILVNINPAYRANELEYALNKVGCRAIVCALRSRSTDFIDILAELTPRVAPDVKSKPVERLSSLEFIIHLDAAQIDGTLSFSDVLSSGETIPQEALAHLRSRIKPSDPTNIQFTSGTTGRSKAAVLTHSNLVNIAIYTAERCKTSSHSAICLPLPLYHVFAMDLGNILAASCGAKVVLPSQAFDEVAVFESIQSERCSTLYGVPTMFAALVNHPMRPAYDLSSLQTAISAGASMPTDLMYSVIHSLGIRKALSGYGMTETSSTITMGAPDDTEEMRLNTIGSPISNVEVKIITKLGETAPIGEAGEVCVRGIGIMLGYWDDDQATREAIDKDGWLHTGDVGTVDAHGYGQIVGRLKEMIIRGGENIFPREIENFLLKHPKIEAVYVVGVPDEKYGEELCACVKVKLGETISANEIREFCDGKIARFKIPRYVQLVDGFPLTATGKVQKYILATRSAENLGLSN